MPLQQIAEITSLVSDALASISAAIVVVVALAGLRVWRSELKGRAQYEAIRELMVLARRFRAAFEQSRPLGTLSSDYADRPRRDNETPEQARVLDEQYARLSRLQPSADILAEIGQAAWEAEIVTGEQIIPLLNPFGEVVRELNVAILQTFDYRLRQAEVHPGTAINPAYIQAHDKTELIYPLKPDELNKRVDDALHALEQKLRKYIR